MSAPQVSATIEPDGVRADEYVLTLTVDCVEREVSTWRTLETALAQLEVRLLRLAYQVFR